MAAKPIPEGYHTVTPFLNIKNADKAIEFYKKAFGAEETFRMATPDGKVGHAEIKIGDSVIMVSEATQNPETKTSLMLYVNDVDAIYAKAISAGAKPAMPVADMFWGDRFGRVIDPYGTGWGIATHKEDISPAELNKRAAAAFSKKP